MHKSILVLIQAIFLFVFSLFFVSPLSGKDVGSIRFPDPNQYEVGTREWFKATEALRYKPLISSSMVDNCPHTFDVLHYNVTLYIDFDLNEILGNTVVTALSELEDLSDITLDLAILTVDSVLCEGTVLEFSHIDSTLLISLPRVYSQGDTFSVQVFYHGQPGNEGSDGFGGFYFAGAPETAFQMGVGLVTQPPSMGKFWIPCWDWPCDKVTAEYHITVPGLNRKVVCNGVLTGVDIDSISVTSTYHWLETHQIAPHLMTVHARRYTELVDSTYDWIHYWVYPTDEEDARIHFQNVDVMMDGFTSRFGPYPFSKFGYVQAPKGDMEHQTCVTHVAMAVQPNHNYDWLLAHEMSHQWWGDCVSINDWRDIWLSEGFATYSEALFHEYAYGFESYRSYIKSNLMNPVFASSENFPIYDPEYLWGNTVYEKGGCVLHMLRHVIGDSLFFEALITYRGNHEYGNAVTTDFKNDVESVCDCDLDWFFNEWVYDVGWPEYEYSWFYRPNGDSFTVSLVVDQVQTNGPTFVMPVDILVRFASGDSLLRVFWIDEERERLEFEVEQEPSQVVLDPLNWILCKAREVEGAGISEGVDAKPEVRLLSNNPGDFFRFGIKLSKARKLRVSVYNIKGQLISDLLDGDHGGEIEVVWSGIDSEGNPVSPGVYFIRVESQSGSKSLPIVLLR